MKLEIGSQLCYIIREGNLPASALLAIDNIKKWRPYESALGCAVESDKERSIGPMRQHLTISILTMMYRFAQSWSWCRRSRSFSRTWVTSERGHGSMRSIAQPHLAVRIECWWNAHDVSSSEL